MKELIEVAVLSTLGLLACYLVGCFMCASFNIAEWHYLARIVVALIMFSIVFSIVMAVALRGVEDE